MATENGAKDIKEGKSAETPKRSRANSVNTSVIVKSVPTPSAAPTITNSITMALHRIPRPPNAFMIFANENRKILAEKHRRESNKEISIRLGKMWRALADDVKGKYHAQAKLTDLEHKKKYPDYVYNPRDARLRKEARRQRQIAGQNLARAMSHHLMVKQAKSSLIQLNSQRLGMQVAQPLPVSCMSNPSGLQSQSHSIRREQDMLRGLSFDSGLDKRPLGYFVTPSAQGCHLPGFPTLLSPRSLPMHLLGNAVQNTTITTSSSGVLSNQTYVSSSSACLQPTSNHYGSQDEQQQRVEVFGGNFALQTSLPQMQSPQQVLPETVQKSALLTLATEAVSQLSVGQAEIKDDAANDINTAPVLVENIVQLPDGEPTAASCVLEQLENDIENEKQTSQEDIAKSEENIVEQPKDIPETTTEEDGKEQQACYDTKFGVFKTDGSYQRFGDTFSQKTPIMTTWISKPESPSMRMSRPMPLYLVHPSNPALLAVRPSASGCISYPVGSVPTSTTPVMAGSPGNVVPWGSGPFFYMPMTDMQTVSHVPPYAYDTSQLPFAYDAALLPHTAMSFEPHYTKGKKGALARDRHVLVKTNEAFAKLQHSVTTAGSSPNESSIGLKVDNGSRVFGQILSSTMQLLNEENGGGDAKPLAPTCHINYETVEKEASPDRKLAELTPVQPNTQYTVYY